MSNRSKMQAEASLLIVLMGSLGDVVRGMGLVSQIKLSYPECRISWLIEPAWNGIVSLHSDIDEVIIFDRPRGLRGVWELRKKLRLRHFDVTLDLQRHFKSGLFSFFSGAQRRIGFHPKNTKEGNYFFNNEHIPFFTDSLNKMDHYLKFTEYLACQSSPVEFGFAELGSLDEIDKFSHFAKKKFIALVMGSSWESKDWVLGGYSKLIAKILSVRTEYVVFIGDKSQAAMGQKLVESFSSERLINLAGQTSLPEVLNLLKAADCAVGPDSGPGHMAAAVGTSYVSLFGPTSPERVAPYKNEHLVVRAELGCAPCYRRKCPGLNRLCMRLIRVGEVFEKIEESLHR